VAQQGQVFPMKSNGPGGTPLWGYRYRNGGRGSRRVQRGGFQSEQDAVEALERALERLRRANGTGTTLTLAGLVDVYLAQHDAQPETIEKLRWLQEIAAWRMTIAPGHRFEATQALRQVLARAVAWGMIDVNPAKQGVDNPQRRRTEKRPFESWAQLAAVAARLGECSGALVMFAAATGLRPGEWIALERRDIDPAARVVYVRRAYRNGRLKCTKTEGSVRAVPLQEIALDAIARLPTRADTDLLFPSLRGTYFDLHNFRTREWKPAQLAVGITPLRRVYDLRHTFATFALRAGISTFDLSRYMGASLTMIDRHYGHLARDGRDHAIKLLDSYSRPDEADVHQVDVAWTLQQRAVATSANRRRL
jgi:integrase